MISPILQHLSLASQWIRYLPPHNILLPPLPQLPPDIITVLPVITPIIVTLLQLIDHLSTESAHKRLYKHRNALGLSQEEIAEILDVAIRTIQRLESGETKKPQHLLREKLMAFDKLCLRNMSLEEQACGKYQLNIEIIPSQRGRQSDLEMELYERYIAIMERKEL